MKKIYAFLAASLLSIASWAADVKIGYTLFDSKTGTLTYYYDFESKRVAVGGELYEPSEKRFEGYAKDIKKVVIDASFKDATTMKSTRRMFFSGDYEQPLVNLTEIEGMENLVTAEVKNMSEMFYSCKSLKSIDLSSLNTANVEDMNSMFESCSSLEELDLSNFDTKNVTDMAYMFDCCNSLKAINLSSFNTQKVASMSSMFQNCKSLTVLSIAHFDMQAMEVVADMFNGCEKLKTIYCNGDWTKKDWEAENVFEGCTSLKGGKGTAYDEDEASIAFARPDTKEAPGYFTSYTSDTRDVVATCTLEGFDAKLFQCMAKWSKSREDLVRYSIETEDVNPPYKVIGSQLLIFNQESNAYVPVEFGSRMVAGQYVYQVIVSIDGDDADYFRFPNAKEDKVVAKMDGSIWYAEKAVVYDAFSRVAINSPAFFLEKDEILEPESYAAYDESISSLTYYCDKNRYDHAEYEEVILLPWTDGAFYLENKDYIGRILIDESFSKSTLTSSRGLFHCIEGTKDIFGLGNVGEINGLENLNTKTMTDLSLLFAFMESIVELDLTVMDLSKVTKTEGMFGMCTNLKKILCDEDLSNVEESDEMFYGCAKLVGGNGTACDGENDTDADYARPDWKDQPGYFTATKPQGVESIQQSEVSIQKVLQNGQLFILRDGKTFNAQGAEVR